MQLLDLFTYLSIYLFVNPSSIDEGLMKDLINFNIAVSSLRYPTFQLRQKLSIDAEHEKSASLRGGARWQKKIKTFFW